MLSTEPFYEEGKVLGSPSPFHRTYSLLDIGRFRGPAPAKMGHPLLSLSSLVEFSGRPCPLPHGILK